MCRNLALVFFLLSLLDHSTSAQSNQDDRFDHVYDNQGKQLTLKQVTAGFLRDGNRYHSDYFDFTYSLADGFVDETERWKSQSKSWMQARFPGRPDPGGLFMLHAEKRPNESADPVAVIDISVDSLRYYPGGITEFMHRTAKGLADGGNTVLQEGEHVDVSGTNFFRADYKMNGKSSGYLTVMVTVRNDFVLLWQFFAHSKEEVDSIASSMPHQLIIK